MSLKELWKTHPLWLHVHSRRKFYWKANMTSFLYIRQKVRTKSVYFPFPFHLSSYVTCISLHLRICRRIGKTSAVVSNWFVNMYLKSNNSLDSWVGVLKMIAHRRIWHCPLLTGMLHRKNNRTKDTPVKKSRSKLILVSCLKIRGCCAI